MAQTTATTFDPEREISAHIIAAIEAGTAPWRKPWTGGIACPFSVRHTGEGYRGINVLRLWLKAAEKGYASPYWMMGWTAPAASRNRGGCRTLHAGRALTPEAAPER